jgi:hypothetical protein
VISENRAYFTHEGAEIVYENLADEIDRYAQEYGVVADRLQEKYFRRKAG